MSLLRKLVNEGFVKRGLEGDKEAQERAEYELSVISEQGYEDYFLIVLDKIKWALENDIFVGPGRGSAGGSLVAYLIGITEINPLEHGLLFERFLNPARVDMPDIDTDYESLRRDEVVDYIKERYGHECVARIPTISKYGLKQAIRDLARIESVPIPEVNSVTKKVIKGMTLENVLESKDFEEFFYKYPRIKRLLPEIYGSVRHRSLHAAGVVVTPKPIYDYLSVEKIGGEIVICFDKDTVEQLGFLKLDILGLITLDIIKATLKLIKKSHGITITRDDLPTQLKDLNDPKVYEIFKKGLTLGIFQFKTEALTQLAKKLQVDNFRLLTDATGLIRPGPLHSGDTDKYVDQRLNGGEPQYINDLLIPILKDTYGVIIYQEQITEIASKIGGFPLSEAEIIRRVVSKSKGSNVLEEYRDKFVYGGMNNRVDKDEGNLIWDVIREAGAYSFNKSHAVEYSVITYWCAWLKTYYPKEFLIALMQFEEDVILNNAVLELRSLSHDVGVPDINKSLEDVSLDSEGNILFGLSDIKHVGQKAIDDILEKRPFESFEDFMDRRDTRVTNTRVIKHLIQAGAFDKFGRRDEFYYQVAVDETPHEWNDKEMTLMQVEVLEMPPKKPISDFYKNPFKEVSITPIEEIDWEESLDEVYVKGTITSYKEKEGYAYLNVHDGTGTANVLLSEEQINLYRDKIPLDEGVITIILKAHTVEGKTTLYSDMMVNLEDLDPYKYEREIDYMENGRKETMHHLQTSQGIKERLGVVVTSFYFLSKKGNKGCRIVFDNGDRLMSFGRLQEPIVPGQIIRYKISKSPFIEVLERW